MKFGKIVDGALVVHDPHTLLTLEDGTTMFTNQSSDLIPLGYKEVVYNTPSPDDGYIPNGFTWNETDTQIIQEWAYKVAPDISSEPEIEERVVALEEALLELTTILFNEEEI